jgi:hypothetical protein
MSGSPDGLDVTVRANVEVQRADRVPGLRAIAVPVILANAGPVAVKKFAEFLTVPIRNPNTGQSNHLTKPPPLRALPF